MFFFYLNSCSAVQSNLLLNTAWNLNFQTHISGQPTNPTPRSQIQSISAQDWDDAYGTTSWPTQINDEKQTILNENTKFPTSPQIDSSVLNDIYNIHYNEQKKY